MLRVNEIFDVKETTLDAMGFAPSSYRVSISGRLPYQHHKYTHDLVHPILDFGNKVIHLADFCDGRSQFRLFRKRPNQGWKLHLYDEQAGLRATFKFHLKEADFHKPIFHIIKQKAKSDFYIGTMRISDGDRDVLARQIVKGAVDAIVKGVSEKSGVAKTLAINQSSIVSVSDSDLIAEYNRRFSIPKITTIENASIETLIDELHRRYEARKKNTVAKPLGTEPQSAKQVA